MRLFLIAYLVISLFIFVKYMFMLVDDQEKPTHLVNLVIFIVLLFGSALIWPITYLYLLALERANEDSQ